MSNTNFAGSRGGSEPAYELGAVATSWLSLAACGGPTQLREALTPSWGDPGGDGPYAAGITVRFTRRRFSHPIPMGGESATH
jgi:hypothetical protein